MAGKKRPAPSDSGGRRVSSRLRGSATKSNDVVPDIYRQMLVEAGASTARHVAADSPERPLKRRRPGERAEKNARQKVVESEPLPSVDHDADDEDIEFEDVPPPAPNVQTILRDSEDEDDDDNDDEMQFEDVDFGTLDLAGPSPAEEAPKDLNLNLTVQKAAMAPAKRVIDRRKPATKEEKERRVHVHKMHVLCLLCHVSMRNRWCNDPEIQAALRPLLTAKMVKFLNPASNASQFGRTESLKRGLQEVADMFKLKYTITERGIRRALWAEDESQLKDYQLPDDIESTLERSDFLEAAKTLKGSRDVGAQLFCALLRCAGVETRLVCSLQPLACVASAPTMPRQRKAQTPATPSAAERMRAARAIYDQYTTTTAETGTPSPRRRLGHPHAAAYNIPSMSYTPSSATFASPPTTKRIKGESPFPVYWVEVLDIALQKWQPVDPLVTSTQWKPRALEPPASDRENCMTYVIGFEADGSAKDVTRRYAKAYNSKTRRMRVDGLSPPTDSNVTTARSPGERWWRRTMRRFAKAYPTDADQIEDSELAAAEAREPMPRNVGDFKDHPVYALERHLRRHEVLVPGAQPAGTVGAGSKGPLERIYRRRDVRIARSRDKWYRLGRVVMPGEEPVKVLPKKKKARRGMWDDEESEQEEQEEEDLDPDKVGLFGEELVADGTPIYMYEQTEPYVPEPVRNGRVPKNKFGNVDVYVPSMVPAGGAHVLHDKAAHAAFILGVDYAPALTGFKFSGRKGTAVLNGVVVPAEAEEGVWAVIAGMEDLEAEAEKERKARVALRWWKRFLMGLRIRERIWANVDPSEEKDGGVDGDEDMDLDAVVSDVTEELDFVDDVNGGGGFLVDEDDDAGGGFMVE
ncbi:Rad4-domain-containing protein [Coniochaeta sp. PMI_546]|nr:Rad4-domain-containing protein [Coniochaeta sp. PMI_546]